MQCPSPPRGMSGTYIRSDLSGPQQPIQRGHLRNRLLVLIEVHLPGSIRAEDQQYPTGLETTCRFNEERLEVHDPMRHISTVDHVELVVIGFDAVVHVMDLEFAIRGNGSMCTVIGGSSLQGAMNLPARIHRCQVDTHHPRVGVKGGHINGPRPRSRSNIQYHRPFPRQHSSNKIGCFRYDEPPETAFVHLMLAI